MGKKKVSFEVSYSWAMLSFRRYMKQLLEDTENYEVYIISNHDSSSYIVTAGNTLGLDNSKIIICNFASDKLQAIQDNKIDIHFDDLQSFIMLVDETSDAHGVLVTSNMNKYENRADYKVVFDRIVKLIDSEEKC